MAYTFSENDAREVRALLSLAESDLDDDDERSDAAAKLNDLLRRRAARRGGPAGGVLSTMTTFSPRDMPAVHAALRQRLGDIVDGVAGIVDMPVRLAVAVIESPRDRKGRSETRRFAVTRMGKPVARFHGEFLEVLLAAAHSIRRCPGCGQLIFARRRDQQHCSAPCRHRTWAAGNRQRISRTKQRSRAKVK